MSLAPRTILIRDAVIQRFEYVFELSWKTLKAASAHLGTICNAPREAITFDFKMKWISNEVAWFEVMLSRNETSHTYNEEVAEKVYRVAQTLPPLVHELLDSLKKRFPDPRKT